MPHNFGKVAVLFGGDSAENQISRQSGKAVLEALLRNNINAIGVDAEDAALKQILMDQHVDCCVIMFHGLYGEGGQAQQLLDELNIPYTGSDAKSSELGMHKLDCKAIWQQAGIKTAPWCRMNSAYDIDHLKFPLAVKPEADGSSIGVHFVEDRSQLQAAFEDARNHGQVMAEEWITGRELTVSIVQDIALPLIEIKAADGFYDYKAKYLTDTTQYLLPEDLPPSLVQNIKHTAKKAFELIGCSGWGRVDFIYDGEDYYILEVNTIPGMTNHSLVPKAADAYGWSFDQLVVKILQTAKG